MRTKYKFLLFEKADKQPTRTQVWECKNAKSGNVLGLVKWYGPWRQYCYFPVVQAVYSDGCLNDITHFIGQLKGERRETGI